MNCTFFTENVNEYELNNKIILNTWWAMCNRRLFYSITLSKEFWAEIIIKKIVMEIHLIF